MKRIVVSMLAICCLAGQASAEMFTLGKDDAMSLYDVYWTSETDFQWLSVTDDFTEYQGGDPRVSTMRGEVGFYGLLFDYGGTPSVQIGGYAGDLSEYEGYSLFLANDNDDPWEVSLYLTTGAGTYQTPWTSLTTSARTATLELYFDVFGVEGLDDVQDLGFWIKGGNDMFHISAVPTPVAVLLGMLGMGVAGLKLRKFV